MISCNSAYFSASCWLTSFNFSLASARAMRFGVISLYTMSNLQIAYTHLQMPSAASDAFLIYSGANSGLAR